ncbi:MAG: 30S ribosomal protein S20 [Candidatus Bipolaricaulota bacterium]|nr:30S ribosomal protein S20 [Candidatus Bipolaricaulota bacterium]MDW8110581.1 30S ribosomal protein S20 [Candidatus Bipolaricaulota bacterium]MDW8329507.1 30S ribosomal protein S20 [Candidatus Bipolaricaulota bacterium]
MPNVKSAEKALRQNRRRQERNRLRKEAIRKILRQIRHHVQAGEREKAKALLPQLAKAADKAAARGAVHPHRAARIKARMMRLVEAQ